MPNLRTPEQARDWLDSLGKTVTEFAAENQLDLFTTYQVLAGTKKGRRGKAHQAAVALGIKQGVVAPYPAATVEG
ncbi:MAG: DNA-binding protein [Halothiobacillaceae bacterium]